MHTAMCLLISFIVLGSLAISSVGLFLPMDDHPMWDVFAGHRTMWNASAMVGCGVFFVMAFTLIDDLDDESSFLEFSVYPFTSFLVLAIVSPPLAQRGHFTSLRIALVLMAVMTWMLLDCVVMLFGWGLLSVGVCFLGLHCSAVAFVIGRASLH